MEEFKNYIENYEVSNFGNVRRKMINGDYKIINGSITNRGYKYFQLIREGKRINYLFHIIVAKLFIGERPENLVIDHIDRNKLNNNVINLRYITQKENSYNQDRVIEEFPMDTEDRKKKVIERYNEINRDKILEKKKQYYYKNKDKNNSNKVLYICEICKKEYKVQAKSLKRKKSNNCSICSSLINLEKTRI